MGKGITSDEIPTGGGGKNFIRHIRLRDDGESCRLWILTEHTDIFWERFHRNMVRVDGTLKYRGMKVCVNSAFGQACDLCDEGDNAGTQFLVWAYELQHFYPEKPDKIETKKVKIGGATFYMEEVNEPRLMRYSIMHRGGIKSRAERHGTVLDRQFEWIRTGEAGSKKPSYTLDPLDKEKMPKEIKALIDELPDLEDVALGKVDTIDGESKEESNNRAVREVSEDDEEPNEFVKESSVKKEERPTREVEEDDDDDNGENPFG